MVFLFTAKVPLKPSGIHSAVNISNVPELPENFRVVGYEQPIFRKPEYCEMTGWAAPDFPDFGVPQALSARKRTLNAGISLVNITDSSIGSCLFADCTMGNEVRRDFYRSRFLCLA